MDAVEAGGTYHITRNGVEVAELRPPARKRRLSAAELAARHRRLPRAGHARMRQEAASSPVPRTVPAVRTCGILMAEWSSGVLGTCVPA
ncbi:MAG TPA: hypothetical protein VKV80_19495 [Streptosporangiaceae bacterium]|nr:hypothetical protein [Streptosporangiaceae bacterium]